MDLAAFRKQRGLKQQDVADALGVSVPHVSQLEKGVVPFTLRLALQLEQWTEGSVAAVEVLPPEDAQLLSQVISRASAPPAG